MKETQEEETGTAGPATVFERLAEKLGVTVRASTVFGEAVERDGITVIPVARARWGVGGGGGKHGLASRREGMGGGGGVIMQPVGFIEISNGESRFRPLVTAGTWVRIATLGGLFLLALARLRRN
ncbi:MAG TPA: spore germination protein GerW family protein [Thermoanaerobaculia bacterium]|nr:spore germination protein GerW family protein [Thermoanaerobaculia bacterium]